MGKIKTITLATLALMTLSCSVVQYPSKTPQGQIQTQEKEQWRAQARTNVDQGYSDLEDTPTQTQNIETTTTSSNQPHFVTISDTPVATSRTPATVANMNFTSRELEHIKFSNYNPFPANENSIAINLAKEQSAFTFPLDKSRLSSGYGMRGRAFHSGVDMLEEAGTPIYAAFDGTVRISKPYAGYGNVVVLRHNNGLETVYGHNTKNLVRPGDVVRSGDQIATVGRTGRATANHLHFEVRIMGQTINPQMLVDVDNRRLQPGTLDVNLVGSQIHASNNRSGVTTQFEANQPAAQQITSNNASTRPTTTTKPSNSGIVQHRVSKGDTLSAIARQYDTTVAKLCSVNNINKDDKLSLGQKIKIK